MTGCNVLSSTKRTTATQKGLRISIWTSSPPKRGTSPYADSLGAKRYFTQVLGDETSVKHLDRHRI